MDGSLRWNRARAWPVLGQPTPMRMSMQWATRPLRASLSTACTAWTRTSPPASRQRESTSMTAAEAGPGCPATWRARPLLNSGSPRPHTARAARSRSSSARASFRLPASQARNGPRSRDSRSGKAGMSPRLSRTPRKSRISRGAIRSTASRDSRIQASSGLSSRQWRRRSSCRRKRRRRPGRPSTRAVRCSTAMRRAWTKDAAASQPGRPRPSRALSPAWADGTLPVRSSQVPASRQAASAAARNASGSRGSASRARARTSARRIISVRESGLNAAARRRRLTAASLAACALEFMPFQLIRRNCGVSRINGPGGMLRLTLAARRSSPAPGPG